jgi:hypothetical protein
LKASVLKQTWRAELDSRARGLDDELDRVQAGLPDGKPHRDDVKANLHIAQRNIRLARDIAAGEVADDTPRRAFTLLRRWASGSDMETGWRAIHAADAALLMVAPSESVKARVPEIRASLLATLGESDGRVAPYTKTLERAEQHPNEHRDDIRTIKSAIDAASDAAHSNVRNYRNWLLIVSSVVTAGLIGVAIAHAGAGEFLYIAERGKTNPAVGADVAQIEAAGAVGGLLMAIVALIRLKVYSGPYALPLWQALVRIPAGAAAALAGGALLQGQVISTLSPQPRSGLLGYAVLFGAAPELVLRFLDRQVNSVSAAARTKDDPLKAVPKQASVAEDANNASKG